VVSKPKLVLIVGCFGLASNILGLFLFHEHGHSHGGHGHAHGDSNLTEAEEGHSHSVRRNEAQATGGDAHTAMVTDEGGNVADVLPQNTIAGWPKTREPPKARRRTGSRGFTKSDEDDSTAKGSTPSLSTRISHTSNGSRRHRRHTSTSRSRFASADDIHIHPASFRNDIIAASRLENIESDTGSESSGEEAIDDGAETENSPLLAHSQSNGSAKPKHHPSHSHQPDQHALSHKAHKHSQPKEEASGGHSHSDLNMRGVFLHVMGDALGNIGVIASALLIWLTHYSWRFYSDPAISLIITIIILCSAIPLCKAASRILLQAVPAGLSVDDIKEDIGLLPGVLSCHHLHVWQLSDTKLVASLHIQVEYDFKGEGSARYMQLARAVRRCLHEYGIHSSTIQPEFCLRKDHDHASHTASDNEGDGNGHEGARGTAKASKTASVRSEPETCLLDCGDECGDGEQCCSPGQVEGERANEETGR
jgi:zinc transporter 1